MAHFVFHRHYRQRFCDNVSHSFFGRLTDCTIYQSAKASLIPNVILLATSRKTGSRLLVVYFFLLPQQFKVDINLFLPDRHYNDYFYSGKIVKKSPRKRRVLNFRHRLIHTSVILLVLALHLTSVFGRNSDQKLKIITFAYVIPSRIHPITSVIVIDVF